MVVAVAGTVLWYKGHRRLLYHESFPIPNWRWWVAVVRCFCRRTRKFERTLDYEWACCLTVILTAHLIHLVKWEGSVRSSNWHRLYLSCLRRHTLLKLSTVVLQDNGCVLLDVHALTRCAYSYWILKSYANLLTDWKTFRISFVEASM